MTFSLSPAPGERGNVWTHLPGAVFALASAWMAWPALGMGWQMGMGVICFLAGMFLMFASSTAYHWVAPGTLKGILRKCDHICIYVMIACSYTPICIGVVGGWQGWLVFTLEWAAVLAGAVYKVVALGRWPRLSLALYLVMGWSVLFVAGPVVERMSAVALGCLVAEGLFYTAGTWFFANDHRPHFHAVWHVFVLLGALSHWGVVLAVLFG